MVTKRNTTLDGMRLVAAIFVMGIHAPLPGKVGEIIAVLGRFAVPFFLMISGYFYSEGKAVKHIKEAAKLLAISTILYVSLNCIGSIVRGAGIMGWLLPRLSLKTLIRLLLFNHAYFISNITYYLLMLIYVYAVEMIIEKSPMLRRMEPFFPVLLAGTVCISDLGFEWFYTGNWLMTGLPFFTLGKRLSGGVKLPASPGVIAGLGVGISVLEAFVVQGERYLGLGALLLCIGVFAFCMKHPALCSANAAKYGRELSVPVFIVHCGIRDVLGNLLSIPDGFLFPIVTALSLLSAMVYIKIAETVVKK